jgi:hypothetical protein
MAPRQNFPIILHFVKGTHPTPADLKETLAYGQGVKFRNATCVDVEVNEGSVEKCDGVSGAVPEVYAKRFPHARDAIALHLKQYVRLANGTVAETAEQLQPMIAPAPAEAVSGVVAGLDDVPVASPLPTQQPEGWTVPPVPTTKRIRT